MADQLTAEEIIKIVLGIIGIGFLIYLSVSLIGIFTFRSDSQIKQTALDEIVYWAENAKQGDVKQGYIIPKNLEDTCLYIGSTKLTESTDSRMTICFCKATITNNCPREGSVCKTSKDILFRSHTGAVYVDTWATEGICNIDKEKYFSLNFYKGADNVTGFFEQTQIEKEIKAQGIDKAVFSFLSKDALQQADKVKPLDRLIEYLKNKLS